MVATATAGPFRVQVLRIRTGADSAKPKTHSRGEPRGTGVEEESARLPPRRPEGDAERRPEVHPAVPIRRSITMREARHTASRR